ncbi:NAD(P)H-binding protein [Stappia sp. GBMRC 2046]|uniref:NAD(P)H-binding protein n=1 Tax=Stappia sediminis TaxID=2692190 RepID=A0A7X3S5U9_9HYPH|nr:NAD(P)H-binding protein [Stappia sediminis]MXN63494.1 NAD(P)H-binding protein [Stappia sediminis]
MRILILGGYGLIGMGLVRRLSRSGHEIVGLGRNPKKGERIFPRAEWIAADISSLITPEAWAPYLEGVDAVINAAGALQDGARDSLSDIHERSIKALIKACESGGSQKFIQISAPGASATSSTAFYRTKAAADAALKESALAWLVLRPGVVIAPAAYGGTALLRALAAFPLVQLLGRDDLKLRPVDILNYRG